MRKVGRLSLQWTVVGALGILATLAAFPGTTTIHSRYVGIYQSDPAPEGKIGPSICVSLGSDGTATVTQDPGKAETTSFGHWVDSGGEVIVTFDAASGTPAEPAMIFRPDHDGLRALTWNHVRWGKGSPPVAKKGSGNWHSRGHWW